MYNLNQPAIAINRCVVVPGKNVRNQTNVMADKIIICIKDNHDN